jgi:hypothetical protein
MSDFTINQKFDLLKSLTNMVISGHTPSLIVLGEGGLGKTHTILECIKAANLYDIEWTIFKGYSTARGLYNTLYDNRNKLIIFDDCDSVLEDKTAINILKSALDSYDKRTITWMSKVAKGDEYPQQFDFEGSIIFISNKSKSSIDGAVLSRSLFVDLTMTSFEKCSRISEIIQDILPQYSLEIKLDALHFLRSLDDSINFNLRTFIMVSKMRASNPVGWRDMAKYMIVS